MNGIGFLSAEPAFLADEQWQRDGPFRGYAVRLVRRGDAAVRNLGQGDEISEIRVWRQGVAGVR